MSKPVGLSRNSKKMLEVYFYKKGINSSPYLFEQAIEKYEALRVLLGNGYTTIDGKDWPNCRFLSTALSLFHLAIEIALKALISLKTNGEFDEIHNLTKLLEEASRHYPNLLKISANDEYTLLFAELSKYFDKIRYVEVAIKLRDNNKKGWKNKKPLQELLEAFGDIFNLLINTWEEETGKKLGYIIASSEEEGFKKNVAQMEKNLRESFPIKDKIERKI